MGEILTIQRLMDQNRRIYGLSNVLRHTSLSSRAAFVGRGLTELERTMRGKSQKPLEERVASLFNRISCLCGHFRDAEPCIGISIPDAIVQAMTTKYPIDHCAYCQISKCKCTDGNRPPLQRVAVSLQQAALSCRSWQESNKLIYGDINISRGLDKLVHALDRENREIGQLESRDRMLKKSNAVIFNEFIEEVGDLIARLFGFSNHPDINIDVESAFWKRYGNGCPHCHHMTCDCLPNWFNG